MRSIVTPAPTSPETTTRVVQGSGFAAAKSAAKSRLSQSSPKKKIKAWEKMYMELLLQTTKNVNVSFVKLTLKKGKKITGEMTSLVLSFFLSLSLSL